MVFGWHGVGPCTVLKYLIFATYCKLEQQIQMHAANPSDALWHPQLSSVFKTTMDPESA